MRFWWILTLLDLILVDGFGCVLVWVTFIFGSSMENVIEFIMFEA